ncbi:MAG: hypothetical protein ACJ72E_17180 [Marmoricola sp.]
MTGRRWVPAACTATLALLALAPVVLARGYVLVGDMSFVPDQPWKSAWLGLDGSVPRAVPADAFTSALSHVVPGDLLQKVVLLGALLGAGVGAIRLVRVLLGERAVIAPTAAAVLYLWNPWVLERLAIGHWGLVVSYAALPWVAAAAHLVRRDGARALALVPGLAVAAFASPTGGIMASLVALVLVAERGRVRRLAEVVAIAAVLNLPWLLPGLIVSTEAGDPAGVNAFAARADTPFGVVGSLLSLGGIWKSSIVPGERDSWFLVGIALLVTVAGLVVLLLRSRPGQGAAAGVHRRLLALALIGFLLAVLPTGGPGRDLVRALVEHVPGGGLLRDSQKWLALFVLPVCVGVGVGFDAVRGWLVRHDALSPALLGAVALFPVILLPSLAWGLAGHLEPVHYPAEWAQARTALEDQPAADLRTAVFPWSAYRRLPWNDQRAALDPALRYFPGEVVTDDALPVGRTTIAGEDPVSARIGAALAAGDPLRPVLDSAGIRYLLVERIGEDASSLAARVAAGDAAVLHDGPELELFDLGHGRPRHDLGRAWIVVVGDVLAAGTVLAYLAFGAVRRIRTKRGVMG